jgi:hypothetical protein
VTDLDRHLDRLVPESDEAGDWGRVLADAERARGPRLSLALSLAAVAAGIAILSLAWPFGDDRPGGVLDRALAAIGEGSALHIVYRGDWGPMSVELSTGEVEPIVAESEVWYDAKRGVHQVWRLDGEVQSEHLIPVRELSVRQEEQLVALADNYRDALQSGKARVIGPGHIGGRPVFWIRVRSEWLPDTSDGRNHLFSEEVAVDRDTYEPIYARSTRDGKPPPGGGGQAIVELEQISADDADFDVDKKTNIPSSFMGGAEFGKLLEPAEFSDALGGRPFWLGTSYKGKPLSDAREFVIRRRANRNAAWEETRGLYLFYGTLRRRNRIPLRALSQPAVELEQFREVPRFWIGWADATVAREGRIVISGRRFGLVLRDGTYISVRAPSVREILEAASELRGVGEPAPPRSTIDFSEVAREVETRQGKAVQVTGGRPVRPRPIARSRGRLVQSGTSMGVSVQLFSGGVARFDTRAMDPGLQRLVRRNLSPHCFRVRGDRAHGGGIGPIPRNGVNSVTVLGHASRGRTPILRPPFDGCELGGVGFGRNWLPRFDWHGFLEIPLTARGRRFFEERAAARELAHFVRNGARLLARNRMKAGAAAPPAARLSDPDRPYIAVSSRGDRFRASLTATTGRRFFIEIVHGRIGPRNVSLPLAFVR